MPLTDLLLPNKSSDAVAIINQTTFEQLFADARPFKVSVKPTSKLMEHPVETGSTVVDHRVIQPLEIELAVFLMSKSIFQDYRSVYAQLKQAFEKGDLLTVQTRAASYANMVIYEIPHTEDADVFDAIAVAVKLREVKYIEPQYADLPESVVADKKQSSTVGRGEQQAKDVKSEGQKISVTAQMTDYISDKISKWWGGK